MYDLVKNYLVAYYRTFLNLLFLTVVSQNKEKSLPKSTVSGLITLAYLSRVVLVEL